MIVLQQSESEKMILAQQPLPSASRTKIICAKGYDSTGLEMELERLVVEEGYEPVSSLGAGCIIMFKRV
jgi:hypothetical protein